MSSQDAVHEEPHTKAIAIAGAKSTEGKCHQAVRKLVRTQLRGWTGNPSAGGIRVNQHMEVCDQSPIATPEYTTIWKTAYKNFTGEAKQGSTLFLFRPRHRN